MPRAQNAALEALKRLHVEQADPQSHQAGPGTIRDTRTARAPAGGLRVASPGGRGTDRPLVGRPPLPSERIPPVEPLGRPGPDARGRSGLGRSAASSFASANPYAPAHRSGSVGIAERGAAEEADTPAAQRARRADEGAEGNARLTGMTAAVLLVLLAAEGITVLGIRSLLTPHVFIGMLLVPPVLVKMGSTGWRFAGYYLGRPAYRRRGAPLPTLRLLGPILVVLTVILFVSGIALLFAPVSTRLTLLHVHQVSFVLWFLAMVLHVLGHIAETSRLAPADWVRRGRRQVRGAGTRQWVIAASLAVGLVLAIAAVPAAGTWLHTTFGHHP